MKTLEQRIAWIASELGSKAKTKRGQLKAVVSNKVRAKFLGLFLRALANPIGSRRWGISDWDRSERRAKNDPVYRKHWNAVKSAETRKRNTRARYERETVHIGKCLEMYCGKTITRSDKGCIIYGSDAEHITDYSYYSKSYGHPAKWVNGAIFRDPKTCTITVSPSSGNKWTIPGPKKSRRVCLEIGACTIGDAYALIGSNGVCERFGVDGLATGLSAKRQDEWEYGESLEEIYDEMDRKAIIRKNIAVEEEKSKRQNRFIKLASQLCRRAVVTEQDALDIGFCRAGIVGFRKTFGIGRSSTIGELRDTESTQAITLCNHIAGKLLHTTPLSL